MLSIFLILEGIRQLSIWFDSRSQQFHLGKPLPRDLLAISITVFLTAIHVLEVSPFLKSIPVQPSHPIGGWTTDEIAKIKRISAGRNAIMISPSWREGLEWEIDIYSLAYYSGLRSNINLLARTLPERDARIARDLDRVIKGEWDMLVEEYGDKILFAIPLSRADTLRPRMSNRYSEVQIGPFSVWARRLQQE